MEVLARLIKTHTESSKMYNEEMQNASFSTFTYTFWNFVFKKDNSLFIKQLSQTSCLKIYSYFSTEAFYWFLPNIPNKSSFIMRSPTDLQHLMVKTMQNQLKKPP